MRKDFFDLLPVSPGLPHYNRMSGPPVLLQFVHVFYNSGPERIQVDIAQQFQEIFFLLTKNRFIPVLKKVAAPLVTAVECYGIAGKNLSHQAAERLPAGTDKKMKVVGKQRPGVAPTPGLRKACFKAVNKVVPVIVVKKYILTIQTSDNDMVNCARNIKAFLSRHVQIVADQKRTVNQVNKLTPSPCPLSDFVTRNALCLIYGVRNSKVNANKILDIMCYQFQVMAQCGCGNNGIW